MNRGCGCRCDLKNSFVANAASVSASVFASVFAFAFASASASAFASSSSAASLSPSLALRHVFYQTRFAVSMDCTKNVDYYQFPCIQSTMPKHLHQCLNSNTNDETNHYCQRISNESRKQHTSHLRHPFLD